MKLDFEYFSCRPHEMRIVERKALLEALAEQLPEGTIRFNSRVTSIKKPQTSSSQTTDLELQDGSTYSAKVGHFTISFQSTGTYNFVQSRSTLNPNLA
jgi:phytoene dehydrogenase-like protein